MPDRDDIILKELDLIDNTISKLDKQIQTTKTVCITLWTAWIGWFIAQEVERVSDNELGWLLMGSAVFPIIFWKVDSYYRKALLSTSRRQNLISLYLNKNEGDIKFPFLDPVGWLYHPKNYRGLIEKNEHTLMEEKESELICGIKDSKIYTYKEVVWFYLPLIIISFLLGGLFVLVGCYIA